MSTEISLARRLPETIGLTVLVGLSIAASPALAQNRLTVDASASAGIATNPYLDAGPTPTAVNGTLGIRPSWVSERPLTTFRIDADAEVNFYNQGYGTNGSVTVQGSGTHKLSAYTTLNASLGYINTIVGSFNDVGVPIGSPLIIDIPTVVGTPASDALVPVIQPSLPNFVADPALNGIGRRRQAYLASGGIATMFTPRDQIAFNMAVSANRTNGSNRLDRVGFANVGADFDYVTPSVSYSRVINSNFNVGASFSVGFTNYRGTSIGDATIYQPSLTATRVVSERWTLTASLGAGIANLNELDGTTRTSTSLNGAASLCRKDTRWTACVSASRQTLPSSFEGVRTQTSVGGSLNYLMNARDNLSLNGGYSHAGDPLQRNIIGVRDGSTDFVNASGSYSHRFAPALSGFVTLGYAKASDDVARRDANLTALAGVTYRLSRQP